MKPVIARLKNRLMRRPLLQRLAAALGREPAVDKWIFIIGCYNSGTTLLARLLERHPAIRALPGEGVAFTDALQRPEEHGWPRLWFKCLPQMGIESRDRERLAARIRRQWAWAASGSGRCMLEKSIANATRLEFFNDCFRPAYFIHITRNGYAVAEGIRRKALPGRWHNPEFAERYPIELCARQWRATEALIERQRAALEHYHALRYEDLVADPEQQLRRILQFVDLSWEPRLLAAEVRVHGASGPIEDMNRHSIERLDPQQRASIEAAAGEWLERLGYRAGP